VYYVYKTNRFSKKTWIWEKIYVFYSIMHFYIIQVYVPTTKIYWWTQCFFIANIFSMIKNKKVEYQDNHKRIK